MRAPSCSTTPSPARQWSMVAWARRIEPAPNTQPGPTTACAPMMQPAPISAPAPTRAKGPISVPSPIEAPGSTQAVTEEFVYDGSYVALREVTLGYTLPRSLMQNLPIEGVRINLLGRNLGYFQKSTPGFAPDAYIFNRNTNRGTVIGMESMSFPIARTFGFDINITF